METMRPTNQSAFNKKYSVNVSRNTQEFPNLHQKSLKSKKISTDVHVLGNVHKNKPCLTYGMGLTLIFALDVFKSLGSGSVNINQS